MSEILHLITDDKFAKYAHSAFSNNKEVKSRFILLSEATQLKHITFDCDIYNPSSQIENIIHLINTHKVLVIHFMSEQAESLLTQINKNIIIIWIGWGGDYYWLIDTLPHFSIYGRKTAQYLKYKDHPFLKFIKKIRRKKRYKNIQRVNYFSPVLKEEIDLIKINYPNFKPKYIPWNYGNLEEDYIKNLEHFKIKGNDILIGNSATPTNNHLDIFESLKSVNIGNKKIHIPLSYGNLNYAKDIQDQANVTFGENAYILSDYLPYNEYIQLLSNCGNIIMGHIRQQAMGNIITFLYFGAKLFFYKNSIVYQHLKQKGFMVFSLEDLQNTDLLENVLDDDIIEKHKMLLLEDWGLKVNSSNTKKIINLCW